MALGDLVIRAATPADAEALATLWRGAWASANPQLGAIAELPHWLDRVASEFGPPCETFLAEHATRPTAFVVLQPWHSYVSQLFVDVQRQSQGLGGQLLRFAAGRMPQGLWLHVAADNLRAQAFYERMGLVAGESDLHPRSGRQRIAYRWNGRPAVPAP